MKLTVLVDNNTFIDRYYCGEPALCFYLEDEETKILFDTGYSDVFIKNAEKLGIDLSVPMHMVLSHGHNDHTGGLVYLQERNYLFNKHIIAHPDVFKPREENGHSISSPLDALAIGKQCDVSYSKVSYRISSRFLFLGEIPELLSFEKRDSIGFIHNPNGQVQDMVMDDSALVYQGKEGLFIITGCSHSGICNIIEYAKQVCQEERISGVIGGFHLFNHSPRLQQTIAYFKENDIRRIYPSHCVSLTAKAEMFKSLPISEVGVGLTLNI
ncbi:MAG: MBL fold metallo-hydrolase [Odoribacter sp.]|nr:MBL fold metallo-hydrolase [Odoribacter sp.]